MFRRRSSDNVDSYLAPTREQPTERHEPYSNFKFIGSMSALFLTLLVTLYMFTLIAASDLVVDSDNKIKVPGAASTNLDYFQTSPQIFAGPTATAQIAPFLAQTNVAIAGHDASFIPNTPLETAVPIAGNANNTNVFQLMGQLSPYFPSPGFGSNEYPLPPGANISQVHVLHRHGARYPTSDSSVSSFGARIHNATRSGTAQWSGDLAFLNNWRYTLGAEILVARGRQELFDSGILHYYNYGQLYNTSTKIIARTTTQDRMLKSAEYFLAGFFGLEWTQNATIEVQIEGVNFNTSLAGYMQCPNAYKPQFRIGSKAGIAWEQVYLAKATERLRVLSGKYDWTIADSYDAQTLCSYETVAYGFSHWCRLFTYEEWQGFEYSIDLQFHGDAGFGSPTGRAIGIGYVQEIYARLQHHLYSLQPGATNVNYTLDTMDSTFPLNQTLYLDFSHDTNIMSILTAFGLKQFAEGLPSTHIPGDRSLVVSHITPFGARIVLEVIQTPQPVKATRPTSRSALTPEYYEEGAATTYVHLVINQRTVPLGRSYPACGQRDDGWCDMVTFMNQLDSTLAAARYEYSCFGDYDIGPDSKITDGVPISGREILL